MRFEVFGAVVHLVRIDGCQVMNCLLVIDGMLRDRLDWANGELLYLRVVTALLSKQRKTGAITVAVACARLTVMLRGFRRGDCNSDCGD